MAQITRKQQQQLAEVFGLPKTASMDDITQSAVSGGSVSLEQQIIRAESFRGPLPSPDTMRQYREVLPQLPERILAMAELEQQHRHQVEQTVIDAQVEDLRSRRTEVGRGQLFGLILSLSAVISGTLLIWRGATFSGLAAFFSGIALVAGSFIYRAVADQKSRAKQQNTPKNEREDKS